ncbi:MAG: hypothetical protein ISP68_04450 [Flavobacteriaceae bacterium]|nr:hypothetical protein [Flavobacteriaceae bacterium]
MSGLKYIVSAPDYLGYQKSSNIPHPYEHGESLATASYDMLVAVKEFLEQEAVLYSDELFLTGFSEGGYASMALHEYIENNTETIVTGSIVAGGAYNKTQFSKEIMEKNETLDHIAYYLWVLHSYNLVYNLNLPFSFFITEDNIAEIIANINNLSGADIDKNPQNLFTEEFRNLILTDADHPFVDAIRDNNRFDWEPKGFVRIYHGSEDAFVFPSNAITSYEAIRSENNEGLVTLELLNTPNQKTHEGSGVLFHTLLPIILHQERDL